MRIVDSPGVVFDDDDDTNGGKDRVKGSVLLRNVVKVEDVEDPIAVGELIRVLLLIVFDVFSCLSRGDSIPDGT